MSGTPKRVPHEEGAHSSASSVRVEEETHAYPRVNYGPVQDTRPGLLPRPDSRDGERRSAASSSLYKMPSVVAPSHPVVGPELRPELRESKDIRENKALESNKEVKVETRDTHSQSGKVEKDGRVESRMDDGKEVKHERERGDDLKGELKVEKDVYGWGVSYPSWKEPNRGKRHPEGPGSGGIPGTWNASQSRARYEASKDAVTGNISKDRAEGNEAVGENRVDVKTDDKYKDRKRKDSKHYDFPESDKDKSDHRSSLQGGSTSNNDVKEATREERESERLEKERKDLQKERERLRDREKDFVDKEVRNGAEKDGYQNETDGVDKPSVQESFTSESKKLSDSWRNVEREAKERRREREGDAEVERPEKRRCYEKESDEGIADVEMSTDKERDVFGYGVQQKKRMLRPRGSPQVANREARFKSRGQDAEGSQGKPEVSAVYKVGECLQELTKFWNDYKSSLTGESCGNLSNGPTLEIRVPAEHVTATNRQVRGGQLWGTDIYTDDSDLVAVLMHTGYCRPTASPPPAAIQELRATIRVLPPQESYVSTLRNNVRSRAWGAAIGSSYRVERCCIVKKGGGTIDLEPCLTHTSAIEPTLAPVAVERTMTTRSAASNALRQQKFVREVTIQYNLCNEPWIKYSISVVADKGLKKALYTSARLKKGEVLYLETHACRYELCFASEKIVKSPSMTQIHGGETEKSQNHVSSVNGDRSMTDIENSHCMVVDMFRWSRCKKPLPQKVMQSIGIPLPLDHVEVLEENVDWEDVQWSQTGVWIAGKEYPLARVHFLSPN